MKACQFHLLDHLQLEKISHTSIILKQLYAKNRQTNRQVISKAVVSPFRVTA